MARSGGLVKNADQVQRGIDFWIARIRYTSTEIYQKIVWDIFLRLTSQTPQYSGRAVANWRIGVGAPDYTFDPDLGDTLPQGDPVYEKGDSRWVEHARHREKKKLQLIKAGTKVFFTNMADGDDGDGNAMYYMEALQNPSYWAAHLRAVNQPYETVHETLIYATERAGRLRGGEFKLRGYSTKGLL